MIYILYFYNKYIYKTRKNVFFPPQYSYLNGMNFLILGGVGTLNIVIQIYTNSSFQLSKSKIVFSFIFGLEWPLMDSAETVPESTCISVEIARGLSLFVYGREFVVRGPRGGGGITH